MSVDWAERQRHTNRLARKLAGHLFMRRTITARQIYGLSKLAWITNSYEGDAEAYIYSTKIPALGDILEKDLSNPSLDEVASLIASHYDDISLRKLVKGHSGFTNFYNAYRNSVFPWIEDNLSALLPLYKAAYAAKKEEDRLHIVEAITKLPGIPKANNPDKQMKPEYFLTPAFFMLDPEILFPLINGNEWVQNLLKALDVADSDLPSQYRAMVRLYGEGGIRDAADLDRVGMDLPDFLTTSKKKATKKLLETKETAEGVELPLKDEADVEAIKKAGTLTQRRMHNQLTNRLRNALSDFTLLEGKSETCMFDVLVQRYDHDGNDLLVEVKSSSDSPQIRMAVGQLFDYWFILQGNKEPHLAILLPERPADELVNFIQWLNIGLMWFEGDQLFTEDSWLESIADICLRVKRIGK